ncbi:hypothetical protein DFH08DRAFT_805960 [Mycena albidolilacea]|uniref:Uncharacterized protein n=1 Tax=Mycena albidolilacea TaxID=1033008 RepID=A0AAD7A7A8_9AGAR|nr:hypothetical protein DFH08DRAFT_805960 [Mycena albidolilacea]
MYATDPEDSNIANTFSATIFRLAIVQELDREASKAYQDDLKTHIVPLSSSFTAASDYATAPNFHSASSGLSNPCTNTADCGPEDSVVAHTLPATLGSLPAVNDFDFTNMIFPPWPQFSAGAPQLSPEQSAALDYIRGPASPAPVPSPPTVAVTVPAPLTPLPLTIAASHANLHTPSALRPPASQNMPPHRPMPPPSGSLMPSDCQRVGWDKMVQKFDESRLRRHQWEWVGPNTNSYLPYYEYQSVSKITDIWTEWVSGLGGTFPLVIWRRSGVRHGLVTTSQKKPREVAERKLST